MSDTNLFYFTLGGLGPEYESFITNVSLQVEDLPFEDLSSLLQSHEVYLLFVQMWVSTDTDTPLSVSVCVCKIITDTICVYVHPQNNLRTWTDVDTNTNLICAQIKTLS